MVPIPGASAFTTLISAAGRIGKAFTFEGFLSPKSGRRKKRLSELIARDEAFIIYESPFRVLKTLKEASEIDSSLICVMGREMTKQFEEIRKMDILSLISYLEGKSATVECSEAVSDDALRAAVTEAGYEVTGIEG